MTDSPLRRPKPRTLAFVGWLIVAILIAFLALAGFFLAHAASALAECLSPPCPPMDPVDNRLFLGIAIIAVATGILGVLVLARPSTLILGVSFVAGTGLGCWPLRHCWAAEAPPPP